MIYLQLLLSFMQVGALSIGGGYAAMPILQSQLVDVQHWLTMAEFTDLVTIAEMTPGPIFINAATFVGMRLAGLPGALIATLGSILPSLIIVSLLAWVYARYKAASGMKSILACLRPAVVALIATAGIGLLRQALLRADGQLNWLNLALCALAFIILRAKKPNPILVMLACGAVSLAAMLLGVA